METKIYVELSLLCNCQHDQKMRQKAERKLYLVEIEMALQLLSSELSMHMFTLSDYVYMYAVHIILYILFLCMSCFIELQNVFLESFSI